MKNLRPHQIGLLAATGLTVLLWLIPGLDLVFLPLQYLNTHLHELSHAIASLITGGSVGTIHVYADGSGVTQTVMTYPVIVASAGYVGSSLIGASMIALGRDPKRARFALLGVAVLLTIECVFWLRGDLTGEVSGLGYLILFWLLGLNMKGWSTVFVVQFVGIQQCLSSFHAVLQLVNPRILAFADNDATILAGITHIPAIIWSVSWALLSLLLMVGAFAFAWSGQAHRFGSPAASR